MNALFASGRIVDAILLLTALEAAGLVWWRSRQKRGPTVADLLGNLLAGVFLLLALRVALAGLPWPWLAAMLTGAGAAHLFDLRKRLRGAPAAMAIDHRHQQLDPPGPPKKK